MPRKRILSVCRAVEKLNAKGLGITLTVAGAIGRDSDEIDRYPFVRDLGIISHRDLMREYHKNKIFIQKSVFETF